MQSERSTEQPARVNPFTAADVAAILLARDWLGESRKLKSEERKAEGSSSGAKAPGEDEHDLARLKSRPPSSMESNRLESGRPNMEMWLEQAAALLGPQAADGTADLAEARTRLESLLGLVFQYDARAILATPEAQEVLLREGAREVIRELAHLIFEGPEVDSDRFKEIINVLKEKTEQRGRGLFQPVRLALAGRAGEGDLDRVILLLDGAANLPFAVTVKGTRQRMLEFCAALD